MKSHLNFVSDLRSKNLAVALLEHITYCSGFFLISSLPSFPHSTLGSHSSISFCRYAYRYFLYVSVPSTLDVLSFFLFRSMIEDLGVGRSFTSGSLFPISNIRYACFGSITSCLLFFSVAFQMLLILSTSAGFVSTTTSPSASWMVSSSFFCTSSSLLHVFFILSGTFPLLFSNSDSKFLRNPSSSCGAMLVPSVMIVSTFSLSSCVMNSCVK